jgi:hypothetical protein
MPRPQVIAADNLISIPGKALANEGADSAPAMPLTNCGSIRHLAIITKFFAHDLEHSLECIRQFPFSKNFSSESREAKQPGRSEPDQL